MADNYAEQYKSMYGGVYSKENAKKAGMDKAQIVKRVAIGAGIVVGVAGAAYLYKQYGMNFADNMIDAGTTLQTLSMDPDRMAKGEAFYTAYKEADKMTYQAMFGRQQANFMGVPFGPAENKQIITAMVDKRIKVAGNNTANRVFNDLVKSNPEFKSRVKEMLADPNSKIFKNLRNPFMNDYEVFNGVALLDDDYADLQRSFYSKLKALGYGAVADVNDRKYSGYNTAAAIVFERTNLQKPVSTLLTDGQINTAQGKHFMKEIGDLLTSPLSAIIAGGASIGIAGDIADRRNRNRYGSKESK